MKEEIIDNLIQKEPKSSAKKNNKISIRVDDEMLDNVVGGNLTYTWFGGQGTCGLNNNNKWGFTDKEAFETMMKDCMINKGMTDIDTLKALLSAGIIHKL